MSRNLEPKQALFEQLAVIARALGSAARLELLDFLAQADLPPMAARSMMR